MLPPAPHPAHQDVRRLALLALSGLAAFLCWLMTRPVVTSLAWATALALVAWPQHRRPALHATLFSKVPASATQGVPVGPMFGWLGLTAPWFRGAVTGVVVLVPVLGPPVVWGPAATFLAPDGRWGAAMTPSAWSAAVVGLADNPVYPVMVGNRLGLHTVPMLRSMIGGRLVFGLAGFFAEPVVVSATPGLLG